MRLGKTPAEALPWEYEQQIRPALQVLVAEGFIRAAAAVGFSDPFTQAFLLRLLSALGLAFIYTRLSALPALRKTASPEIGRILLLLLAFTWFMPYQSARFSSENWSGAALWGGLGCLLGALESQTRRSKAYLFLGAFCIALSFYFRFQMAFAIAGLGVWLLVCRRLGIAAWLLILLGGVCALGVGAWADRLFYGEWVCTPYRYFYANIIENKAQNWGVSPWYYYFTAVAEQGIPPVSVVLLFLGAAGWYRLRREALAWVFTAFALAHMLIGHKELRFLFPMSFAFLLFAAEGWARYAPTRMSSRWLRGFIVFTLFVNGLLLVVRSAAPAQNFTAYHRFIYREATRRPGIKIWAEKESPYRIVGLETYFYRPTGLDIKVLDSWSQLDSAGLRSGDLLVDRSGSLAPLAETYQLQSAYNLLPDWALPYNFNHWQQRSYIWSVYRTLKN